MIDPGLHPPLLPIAIFHLKQLWWLYLWPVAVGFTSISAFQLYVRVASSGRAKPVAIFLLSGGAAMFSLFGWVTMVRSLRMIPLYGCGVGLANVVMSRIYAVSLARHSWLRMRLPKVVWRGDPEEIRKLQQNIQATSARDA